MNISIRDFMETINYRITEGTQYGWRCYGDNSYELDSLNGDNDSGYNVSMIFDTKTQVVYEMSTCDYKNNRAYRWIHPDFREKFNTEAGKWNSRPKEAWDDVDYIDLETAEDILEKTESIVAGEEYDTRVNVPIELDDKDMFNLMRYAHEKDITLNKLIEDILVEEISKHKL